MIKFGVQPTITGQDATPADLRAFAIEAERLGYHALSAIDRVVVPLKVDSVYAYNATGKLPSDMEYGWFEPFTLLAMWAGLTSSITLQTSVLVASHRNPVITAKMCSCLDVLSGGRLEVGVGSGWMEEEMAVVRAPDFKRRGQVTDEYIKVYRTLWDDERPAFKGEFYEIADVLMLPRPVSKPRLPILIGGNSRPAQRRAASLAEGWQPLRITADEVRAGCAFIASHAASLGRQLPEGFQTSIRFGLRVSASPTERRPLEEPHRVMVGTPDEVADQVRTYVEAGATAFMYDLRSCSTAERDESLALFAKEVMPRFS